MFSIDILLPFQTSFSIKTDCSQLVNSLTVKYGKYSHYRNCLTDHTITVIKKDTVYDVSFFNDIFVTDAPLRKVEDIMYDNRKYDENIFAVHGGAVEFNNGAYLIVAATTSGKTTLTSYLTANGCGYITDDCILIDRNSFEVHPFNTPIHLRGGGYEVLKKLELAPEQFEFLDDVSFRRYVYTPKDCVIQPIPLKKIFFIERTKNINNSQNMSTTERLTALLKSPIINYKLDANYLSFISKLAQIPCEKLYYYDMGFVFEVIKNG